MQSLKYKKLFCIISVLCFLPAFAATQFTDNQCLDAGFATKVAHKAFPLGLTETILEIEKKDCHLIVRHEKLKYLKKQWDVDVCRGPIHIKYGATSVEVIKRQGVCKNLDSDFCKMADELFRVLQDDGLIFAPGEKEDLGSAHGRVNCSYLLLKAYLEGANVFTRQEQYEGVLKKFSNSWDSVSAGPAPVIVPVIPVTTPTALAPTTSAVVSPTPSVLATPAAVESIPAAASEKRTDF